MVFQSKNMNYIFNIEYFEKLDLLNNTEKDQTAIKNRNKALREFKFLVQSPAEKWKELANYQEVSLYTLYPGLLIGTGSLHGVSIDGCIKSGFSFDYVTGLPYMPGSSLKGMLRSMFPGDAKPEDESNTYADFIKSILKNEQLDVDDLKKNIFENGDIFLGGFPALENEDRALLEMDFITPHKNKFKNPIPINIIKIKPNVKFTFGFLLSDYVKREDKILISADQKRELFEELILAAGIGAKSNVGYGRFSKEETKQNETSYDTEELRRADKPKCQQCGKEFVNWNEKKDGWNRLCVKCFRNTSKKKRGWG